MGGKKERGDKRGMRRRRKYREDDRERIRRREE